VWGDFDPVPTTLAVAISHLTAKVVRTESITKIKNDDNNKH